MNDIKYGIFFDNGISGACCILNLNNDEEVYYFEMPTFKVSASAKTKKGEGYITRIDHKKLYNRINKIIGDNKAIAILERMMQNPGRFKNSISAARAFESTLVVLENLNISYEEIDSRTWQHALFEKGTKGREQLKLASLHLSQKLFPQFHAEIQSHTDGDSFLIGYYYKQKILQERNSNGK